MYLSEHVSKKAKFNKAVVSHKKNLCISFINPTPLPSLQIEYI